MLATAIGCSDETIVVHGPPIEEIDRDAPIDGLDDDGEYTPEEFQEAMDASIDAGFDPPEEEPETPPEPIIGPPPPPDDTVRLIPVNERMEQILHDDRLAAWIRRLNGLKIAIMPVGTPAKKGIPFYFASHPKFIGMAFTTNDCIFAACNGRARIWIDRRFQDDYRTHRIRVEEHELGHIITGFGVKSRLDTVPPGHLADGNMMDKSSNRWFTVLDGAYWCENAPCTHTNREDIYIGNDPYFKIWPWLYTIAEDGGVFPSDELDGGAADGGIFTSF